MVNYKLACPTLSKKTKMLTKCNTSDARYVIVATLKVVIEKPKPTTHLKRLQWIAHALDSIQILPSTWYDTKWLDKIGFKRQKCYRNAILRCAQCYLWLLWN